MDSQGKAEVGVRLTAQGKPFAREQDAQRVLDTMPDKELYAVKEHRNEDHGVDGWMIAPKQEPVAPVAVAPPTQPNDYWWVLWTAQSRTDQQADVVLGVAGEKYQAQRGVWTIAHDKFLEAADHAVETHYRQVPGQQNKVPYLVMTYPYTKGAKSSLAEKEALKVAIREMRYKAFVEAKGLPDLTGTIRM